MAPSLCVFSAVFLAKLPMFYKPVQANMKSMLSG